MIFEKYYRGQVIERPDLMWNRIESNIAEVREMLNSLGLFTVPAIYTKTDRVFYTLDTILTINNIETNLKKLYDCITQQKSIIDFIPIRTWTITENIITDIDLNRIEHNTEQLYAFCIALEGKAVQYIKCGTTRCNEEAIPHSKQIGGNVYATKFTKLER